MEITSFYFFCFYAVLLFLYYILPKRLQLPLLLAAGVFFYASQDEFRDAWLLVFPAVAVLSTWFCVRKMTQASEAAASGKAAAEQAGRGSHAAEQAGRGSHAAGQAKEAASIEEKARKKWLTVNTVILLGGLIILKYLRLIYASAAAAEESRDVLFSGPVGEFLSRGALPLGLSFYTFILLGYTIDVYNRIADPEKSLLKTAVYGTYFPLMISGPITRYREDGKSLFAEHSFSYDNLTHGLQRMLYGVFKKLVIAERCGKIAAVVFAEPQAYAGFGVWIGILAFTFQLYTDFSGCMDIVIGLSETLGIAIPENFRTPFFAKDISEYWRRWHSTLGIWMKEYVFYPLLRTKLFTELGKKLRARFGRKTGKNLTTYIAMFVLWLTVGLWHGGELKYVIGSGLLHWFYIVFGMVTLPFWEKFFGMLHIPMKGRFADGFRILRTFFLVNIGNTFFRAASVPAALHTLREGLRIGNALPVITGGIRSDELWIGLPPIEWVVLIVSLLVLLTVSLLQQKGSVREMIDKKVLPVRWLIWFALLFYTILLGEYGPGYSAAEFIYQGF